MAVKKRGNKMSLTLTQIASLLEAAPDMLSVILSGLPDKITGWHPAEGEWCVKESVGHLMAADQNGFDGRIRTILAEDIPHLQTWDISGTAAARQDCQRHMGELLEEWSNQRSLNADLIVELTDKQLLRTGIHPTVGELSIHDILYEWVHHDQNHIKQIMSNIQAFAWPHMGNAQKFS
jgi:hypothetical protein